MSKFYALDFDRTLGRTSHIASEFVAYVEGMDGSVGAALGEEQRRIESSGGSVDMIAVLRAHLGSRALEESVEGFLVEHRKPSYLEEGAAALLTSITEHGHRLGIMTYGSEYWQLVKLRATLLDSYKRMILANKGIKGATIASWYDTTQHNYKLPEAFGGGTVDEVILVDDKGIEFRSLPNLPSAHGYLFTGGIQPEIETSPQMVVGDIPGNVTVVDSLHDIARNEGF